MAMLKTISEGHINDSIFSGGGAVHTGSVKDLDDYLAYGPKSERKKANIEGYLENGHDHPNRCLAFGKTKYLLHEGQYGWSKEMDMTRETMEITFRKNSRTYYHFVISPDPSDHVGAEELRDIGLEWIDRCFPKTQAIVSVHNDNKNSIMHAHIVINAVYPDTGKRVHITKRQTQLEARVLQDICHEHGMATMPNKIEKNQAERRQKWARQSMAEQKIESRGKWSWKQDIRNAVDRAAAGAMTWGKFCYLMANQGYKVKINKHGEVTYYHPKSTGYNYRVRGIRLGDAYTKQGVNARLLIDMDAIKDGRIVTRQENAPRKVIHYRRPNVDVPSAMEKFSIHLAETAGRTCGNDSEKAAKAIQDNLEALSVLRTYGFKDANELARAAAQAEVRSEQLIENIKRTTNTLERLNGVYQKSLEVDKLNEQLRHLPTGSWSPKIRRQRNELEKKTTALNNEVEAVLAQPDVHLTLFNLGLDNKWQTQLSKVQGLIKVARDHADAASRQSISEQAGLKRIINAEKTMERGMYPHQEHHGQSKPIKLASGVRVPNFTYDTRPTEVVEEALINLAAAKKIVEGKQQLEAIDKAIAEQKSQQEYQQQIQAQQYRQQQNQNASRHM